MQRNAADGGRGGFSAQAAQHLVAVHVGQLHVQQDQHRLLGACHGQAAGAVDRRQELQVGALAHQLADHQQVDLVVLDVEQPVATRQLRQPRWRQPIAQREAGLQRQRRLRVLRAQLETTAAPGRLVTAPVPPMCCTEA